MPHPKEERTLVLIKPDALQRNLFGEIVHRLERKGLKIIGMKMVRLDDVLLKKHYGKYADKPFFGNLSKFMSSAPVIAMVLSGIKAVSAVRFIVGSTKGYEADAGTIRGDFTIDSYILSDMDGRSVRNLVHASGSTSDAEKEIALWFKNAELHSYKSVHDAHILE